MVDVVMKWSFFSPLDCLFLYWGLNLTSPPKGLRDVNEMDEFSTFTVRARG
jgi:hypothetical protein